MARLQWAVGLGYEMCCWHFDRAAGMGRLEVLQWARANGCDWNWDTCSAAAEGGHLEVLQWARANGCPWDRQDVLSAFFKREHPELCAWVLAQPE